MKAALFASIAVASLTLAVPAKAADIGARSMSAAPFAAPLPTWAGLYIGVNGGWGFGSTEANHFGLPATFPGSNGDYNLNHNLGGGIVGGQIGYNWQRDKLVWGLEADFDSADFTGTGMINGIGVAQRNGGAASPSNFVFAGQGIEYFGTVRGRLGMVAGNNMLAYATGGLAYARVNYSGQFHYAGPVDYFAADSKTQIGWTIGAGLEYQITPNWSVRGEYLYYDLGDHTLVTGLGVPAAPPFQSQFNFQTTGSMVRAAINYKLNWAGL